MVESALLIFSYFLGSIPFGFLVAYLVGKIDIRNFGSGNIGATNVFRVVGKKWGILVFIFDFLKGFFPPFLVGLLLPFSPNCIFLFASCVVVAGHNWPIFLKFKGGKGVATSLGAVSALSLVFPGLRIVLTLSLSVWAGIFLIFRLVSLASLSATAVFFVLSLFFSVPWEIKIFSFILLILILIRHKKNIKNLISKKEFRF